MPQRRLTVTERLLQECFCSAQNVYEEIENLEPVIQKLQQKSEVLTAKSHGEPADSIRNNMKNLAQRWEHARSRAGDRKVGTIIRQSLIISFFSKSGCLNTI